MCSKYLRTNGTDGPIAASMTSMRQLSLFDTSSMLRSVAKACLPAHRAQADPSEEKEDPHSAKMIAHRESKLRSV